MFGARRRALQSEWGDWNHIAHWYKYAETALRHYIDGQAAGHQMVLHKHSAAIAPSFDPTRARPVAIWFRLDRISADHVDVSGRSGPTFVPVMEWPLDRYTVNVSEDGRTVTFTALNEDDPGDALFLSSSFPDLGWWARLTVTVREHGPEATLASVCEVRAEHLANEPECPYSDKERRRRMGNVDDVS